MKRWTEKDRERLRHLYPQKLNAQIADEFGVTIESVKTQARKMRLYKPEGFSQLMKKEIYARRNNNSQASRRNHARFKKGNRVGEANWFRHGPRQPSEEEKNRLTKSTSARRKQTYDELLRIKYGLRRQTKLHLPDKVYNIDKKKYFPDNDSD